MKFKVGDKVKCIENLSGRTQSGLSNDGKGNGWQLNEEFIIKKININGKSSQGNVYFGSSNGYGILEDFLKLISNKSKLMKLNTMMKKLLDKDVRTLIKADYLNGDLEFTDAGKEALFSILFAGNKQELVESAQEVIEEAKEK